MGGLAAAAISMMETISSRTVNQPSTTTTTPPSPSPSPPPPPHSTIIYPLPFKLINAVTQPGNTGAEVTGMPLGVLLLYW